MPRDLLIVAALFVLGLLLVVPHTWTSIRWHPDSLFYQAQTNELRGDSRDAALGKVFSGDLARQEKTNELKFTLALRRIENPAWVSYSSRFYRRRWVLPLLAAPLTPIAGIRSLEYVSLFGLVLLGPLIFLLLRSRFSATLSAAVAVFCLFLPPVLAFSSTPGTDYLGLALLLAALIAVLRVADGGRGWLVAWFIAMLALSFTRDATVVALAAVGWLAFVERSRRLLLAIALGVLASLPAPVIFSVPVRDNLAYVFNEFRIPTETGWGSILVDYPSQLGSVVRGDLRYPLDAAFPPLAVVMGLIVLVGLGMLFASRLRHGALGSLARGSVAGAALTILVSVNYTQMRLELVFLPAVAVGVAFLFEGFLAGMRRQAGAEPDGLGESVATAQ